MFASGLSVEYAPSVLVAKNDAHKTNETLINGDAENSEGIGRDSVVKLIVGKRFPSAQVINQAGARPWPFAHFLRSDGRFRLVLFAGKLSHPPQRERVELLCKQLASPGSFVHRFTKSGERIDSTIEILTIHAGPRTAIELLDLPEILHPFDEKTGWDYDKVFVDDVSYHEGFGDAYTKYGVDRESGRLVVVRPDQYVAWMGNLEDLEEVERYFEGVLLPQK